MKLEYQVNDNFGDRLNEWFWELAAPGLIDDDPSSVVLGMGTILGDWFTDRLPLNTTKVIVGSGAGDKGNLPVLTEDWVVYGVRGPLTASYFGLGPEMVIGDPAILLNRFADRYSSGKRQGVGFMPHCYSLNDWDWKTTCQEAGLIYISPRDDPDEVIRQISGLESLIAEAMHGAIVADAVRVPWPAVRISHKFWASKWCDWAGSLGVNIKFHQLHQLRDQRRASSTYRLKQKFKRGLANFGFDKNIRLPASKTYEVKYARQQLEQLATQVEPQLSKDAALETAVCRIEAALDAVVRDKKAGRIPVF